MQRLTSGDEHVFKYVFTKANAVAEAVLYRYPDFLTRTVICCSTQSGCPIGCRFCGAGDNFVRSLKTEEIVSQSCQVIADQGINVAEVQKMQIMFMSMGEPLLNWRALEGAIVKLADLYPKAQLLISTSAPRVDFRPVRALSKLIPTVGLQFSIHETTDEARNNLIPFKAKLTLAEIAKEGECWHQETKRMPFFNYCAREDNTLDRDVERLAALFNPRIWQCTISVVCERDESCAASSLRQKELAATFSDKMISKGFSTRTFDPAGQDDIGGGCGQLWFVQQWMRENPSLARPSAGRGKQPIHIPQAR